MVRAGGCTHGSPVGGGVLRSPARFDGRTFAFLSRVAVLDLFVLCCVCLHLLLSFLARVLRWGVDFAFALARLAFMFGLYLLAGHGVAFVFASLV